MATENIQTEKEKLLNFGTLSSNLTYMKLESQKRGGGDGKILEEMAKKFPIFIKTASPLSKKLNESHAQ